MKRIEFLKSLAVLPFFKFLKVPAVTAPKKVAEPQISLNSVNSFSYKGLSVIHILEPTLPKIRVAAQTLAGRNNYPFENGRYHGLISKDASKVLCVEVFGHDIEAKVVELWGGGVTFKVVDFIDGAIIFGLHSDPLTLESH